MAYSASKNEIKVDLIAVIWWRNNFSGHFWNFHFPLRHFKEESFASRSFTASLSTFKGCFNMFKLCFLLIFCHGVTILSATHHYFQTLSDFEF